jgi:hypothetical protein
MSLYSPSDILVSSVTQEIQAPTFPSAPPVLSISIHERVFIHPILIQGFLYSNEAGPLRDQRPPAAELLSLEPYQLGFLSGGSNWRVRLCVNATLAAL